ncbi:hypothetical protein niasHT_007281 [Heterodera trifolii]|uniref:Uncharacterized protein n=1 Tax=Heterodera trifolii TaxID=157864 RepID=A0ABD2LL76_9BILA
MSGNDGGNGVQQQTRAPQGLTMAMGGRKGRQNGAIDYSRRRRPALLASAGRYRGVKIEFDAVKKERDERQKSISNWRTITPNVYVEGGEETANTHADGIVPIGTSRAKGLKMAMNGKSDRMKKREMANQWEKQWKWKNQCVCQSEEEGK